MHILKCEMCGGKIKISLDRTLGTCESCGTVTLFTRSESTQKGDALLRRGFIFLEDKNWNKAAEYFNNALDIEPECARAYIGLLCVDLMCSKQELLVEQSFYIHKNTNYIKAMRFGDVDIQEFLQSISSAISNRIDKKNISDENLIQQDNLKSIAIGENIVIGLRKDGTVISAGKEGSFESNVDNLKDIISVSAETIKTLALRSDGTVVSIGGRNGEEHIIDGWSNIVAISSSAYHTAALRNDGIVMENLSNMFVKVEKQNIYDATDVVAIAAGYDHIVCLQSNGKALSVGEQKNILDWTDVVAVAAGFHNSVGLRLDRTVVASGQNDYGECDVDSWTDIVAIAASGEPFSNHTVGLRADGTVVATGKNKYGQCDVTTWRNIIAIFAGVWHTAGLRADGTILLAGRKKKNIFDSTEWTDIRCPDTQ